MDSIMANQRGRKRTSLQIDFKGTGLPAITLNGRMKTHSTRHLHTHGYHQVLTIWDGVSLLVDQTSKQPLFGSMTAFIPGDRPHRSIVIGDEVGYKSLYLSPELFDPGVPEILLFDISDLGAALFNRIHIRNPIDLESGLNLKCLELLLKVLKEDMTRPANLVRLPEPSNPQNRDIINFIENNYSRRLTMPDFEHEFPYSGRHLSRVFKQDLKITIFDYLRLYRVLMASIELNDPVRSITDIAYGVGYDSISSFYRDFNLIFAVTPKAFRKRTAGEV
jgi:AraC-like DNA-binding protein